MTAPRPVVAPADGSPLGEAIDTPVTEVPELIATARAAAAGWAATPPHERAAILRRAAATIHAAAPSMARLHAAESGKVLAQAEREVLGAAALLEGNAELARTTAGSLAPTGALPGGEADLTFVERVPLGVVVAVIPFNFPVELTIEKAGAALAAGNVAIVKAPPQNPLATGEVVNALIDAGLPAGVLQLANGGRELSAALCSAAGVDAVSLTGSVGAGIAVARATADQLRPLHLELGGNDAALVLPDADLDHVVAECLRGRLLMNGQACAATKRIIAVGGVGPQLVDRLEVALDSIAVGGPLDDGTELSHLIDAPAARRVAEQVGHAVDQGATLVRGGEVDGPWHDPTLLTGVPPTADVAVDDEIFGPVFTLIEAGDATQAIEIANASSLGLTGAVFSADIPRALAIGQQLVVGGLVVNGTNNYRPPVVPFGGVGLAGAGREGLGYTMEELTRTRFVALRGLRGGSIERSRRE